MQHHPPAPTSPSRNPRTLTASLVAVIGAILMTVGVSAGSVAGVEPTQTIPLSNESADVEFACPDDDGDYWHFVLTPNNDTFDFVSITLDLGGDMFTFSGGDIILNGGQLDNVFVAPPFGYDLFDLVRAGSSADVTPATGTVKFVLSHLCDGYGTSTTTTAPTTTAPTTTVADTTTTAPTTTTVADTTTTAPTTTTVADTTTTAPTTTTVADTTAPTTTAPTTTVADTTTTTTGGQSGATTTTTTGGQSGATTTTPGSSSVATTTIVAQSAATTTTIVAQSSATTTSPLASRLPATGNDGTQPLTLIGGVLTLLGVVMLLSTRRLSTLD